MHNLFYDKRNTLEFWLNVYLFCYAIVLLFITHCLWLFTDFSKCKMTILMVGTWPTEIHLRKEGDPEPRSTHFTFPTCNKDLGENRDFRLGTRFRVIEGTKPVWSFSWHIHDEGIDNRMV